MPALATPSRAGAAALAALAAPAAVAIVLNATAWAPAAAFQRAQAPAAKPEMVENCPGLVALRRPPVVRAALRPVLASDHVRFTYVGHSTFLIESPQLVRIATDYNDYVRPPVLPDIAGMAAVARDGHRPRSPVGRRAASAAGAPRTALRPGPPGGRPRGSHRLRRVRVQPLRPPTPRRRPARARQLRTKRAHSLDLNRSSASARPQSLTAHTRIAATAYTKRRTTGASHHA